MKNKYYQFLRLMVLTFLSEKIHFVILSPCQNNSEEYP